MQKPIHDIQGQPKTKFANLLEEEGRFIKAVELETSRGLLMEEPADKALETGLTLADSGAVDVLFITDNPGGHPHNRPETLGTVLSERNLETVINVSCKDYNRNALESRLWGLSSLGFDNVLALSGDYPSAGINGTAEPVFDIDSVGLLEIMRKMNEGLSISTGRRKTKTTTTRFFPGVAVNPFKKVEGELMTQYFKFAMKMRTGARWAIAQIGFDSRKLEELLLWSRLNGCEVPLLGSIFVLNRGTAAFFNRWGIPGLVLTDALLNKVDKESRAQDKGRAFFDEFAAKQIAILRGLGCRGVYMSGRTGAERTKRIFDIESSFEADDWHEFADEILFPQDDEFYLFEQGSRPGRSSTKLSEEYLAGISQRGSLFQRALAPPSYLLGRTLHSALFSHEAPAFGLGKRLYSLLEKSETASSVAHGFEQAAKVTMYGCRDCGDCSLPDLAYLCPESQCVKNQRNGPCGGTKAGMCEVLEKECIWVRAYNRLKLHGEEKLMLEHKPIFKNAALKRSSAWANSFMKRDNRGT